MPHRGHQKRDKMTGVNLTEKGENLKIVKKGKSGRDYILNKRKRYRL